MTLTNGKDMQRSPSSPPSDLHKAHNLQSDRDGIRPVVRCHDVIGSSSGLAGELQLFHDVFLEFHKNGEMGKALTRAERKEAAGYSSNMHKSCMESS